jgi:hypothetical protein
MGYPFTEIGSLIAALRRPSAFGIARLRRLREMGQK